jgi:hypothetical protein
VGSPSRQSTSAVRERQLAGLLDARSHPHMRWQVPTGVQQASTIPTVRPSRKPPFETSSHIHVSNGGMAEHASADVPQRVALVH